MFELKELLWEITLQCNKGCKYCGSKEFIRKEENIDRNYIANEIVKSGVKDITITGGEPTTVMSDLINVSKFLSKNGVNVKILTNGQLFNHKDFKELDKYVLRYGYSINEKNDIKQAKKQSGELPFDKIVMITNFGNHNINLLKELMKFSVQFVNWQVQLTMGNEFQLDIPEIKKLLVYLDKINKVTNHIVQADNLNCCNCSAGISGCSITWDGEVVPCLSYRSWKKDLNSQGNVFKRSLKNIWEKEFKFFRNREHVPCCKDITGINKLSSNSSDLNKDLYLNEELIRKNDKEAILYGVLRPDNPIITVYGVNNQQVFVYGINQNHIDSSQKYFDGSEEEGEK